MITKEMLKEYSYIRTELKELTEKEAILKQAISHNMIEADLDKVESDFGTFSLAKRKSWTYPQEILEMAADLSVAKKTAEAKGEAQYTESTYSVFKEAK